MDRILFFDGVCNLCNGFVDILISTRFEGKFAPIQGQTAKLHLTQEVREEMGSVVYLRYGIHLERTAAVRAVLMDSGGLLYAMGRFLSVLPQGFTDWIYDILAKNRYRIFGKRKSCRIPNSAERERFLP